MIRAGNWSQLSKLFKHSSTSENVKKQCNAMIRAGNWSQLSKLFKHSSTSENVKKNPKGRFVDEEELPHDLILSDC